MLFCLGLGQILLAAGCVVGTLALPALGGASSLAYSEYRDGEYVLALDASRAVCEMAVRQSCQHFRLAVSMWRTEPQSTAVTLQNAQGDRFSIWLADIGHDRTAVYIRVGLWGDDLCSRQLAGDLAESVRDLRSADHAARQRSAPVPRQPARVDAHAGGGVGKTSGMTRR